MPPRSVAFLGPEGTFTSEAAALAAPDARREPLPAIPDVFAAVRQGRVDCGVVPIENLIEGSVNLTLDELAFGDDGVFISGELVVPVSMSLLARPGTGLEDVAQVSSHPHALAQCRGWLEAKLPGAERVAAASTAEAVRAIAEDGRVASAAIGTPSAAELYGLQVLANDIHDRAGNATRFVVLSRRLRPRSGADKTSLVVFFGEDRAGLLLRVLDELALRGINLSKIESRPMKTNLGEYCILLDCEGHPADARLSEALRNIHRHVAGLKILGAYQRADGRAVVAESAESDASDAAARDWMPELLSSLE